MFGVVAGFEEPCRREQRRRGRVAGGALCACCFPGWRVCDGVIPFSVAAAARPHRIDGQAHGGLPVSVFYAGVNRFRSRLLHLLRTVA